MARRITRRRFIYELGMMTSAACMASIPLVLGVQPQTRQAPGIPGAGLGSQATKNGLKGITNTEQYQAYLMRQLGFAKRHGAEGADAVSDTISLDSIVEEVPGQHGGHWIPFGLNGRIQVLRYHSASSTLVAGTSNGAYFAAVHNVNDPVFRQIGPQGTEIQDISFHPSSFAIYLGLAQGPPNNLVLIEDPFFNEWSYRSVPGTIKALVTSTIDPNLMLAATREEPEGKIYRSSDGGLTWQERENLYVNALMLTLTTSENSPNTFWYGGQSSIKDKVLMRSRDNGMSWEFIQIEPWSGDDAVFSIHVSYDDPNIIFIGTKSRIWKSQDGGDSWDIIYQTQGSRPENFTSIEQDHINPSHVIATGIHFDYAIVGYESFDSGENWHALPEVKQQGWGSSAFISQPEGIGQYVIASDNGIYRLLGNPADLVHGWNAVSLPFYAGLDAESALQQIRAQAGSVDEIVQWNTQKGDWTGHLIGIPFGNFPLVPGSGYFVKSQAHSAWRRYGQRLVTEPLLVLLASGWNFVAFPGSGTGLTTVNLWEQAVEQGTNIQEIVRWDAHVGSWRGYTPELPFLTPFPIEPTEPYFIRTHNQDPRAFTLYPS